MFSGRTKALPLLFFGFIFSISSFAQISVEEKKEDEQALEKGIELIRRYFAEENEWYITQPKVSEDVQGVLHFIEDRHIDSILADLNLVLRDSVLNFVYRLPENVADSLSVPGYYPYPKVEKAIEEIGTEMQAKYQEKKITVPLPLITDIEEKTDLVSREEVKEMFADSALVMPENLQQPEVIPDSLMQSADDFQRFLELDSLREKHVRQIQLSINDSLISAYRDSVVQQYAQKKFEEEYHFRTKRLIDSVKLNNYHVLRSYNDSIIRQVNDSIYNVIAELARYADYIDTTRLVMENLTNGKTDLVLSNYDVNYARFWLKNKQNDSLSVLVKNLDKNRIQMVMDDGVTFSRFRAKESRRFDFSTLSTSMGGLTNMRQRYEVKTPWRIGGDGTVGFTQTYAENWKKGGKSSLSLLLVLKGFANYSGNDGKIKWENSGEIRNGWIRQGGEGAELQKNDDKLELTSRFGVSAFKQWYYSAEFNYETQWFRGYRYPRSNNPNPISAFMSPARTFFKIGLDYKPNRNFSLLLSPLTLKNVYVRDTVLIDQTKYGIDEGDKGFWEPGLNADIKYRTQLTDDILYEMKYKMFINYNEPFRKFDINWENNLVMQMNDYIDLRLMIHLIYDDDVLFPVYDVYGNKTGREEPKLQVKELITVGFSYKINRRVTRTSRVR